MANRRILIIDDDVDIWNSYQAVLAPDSTPFQSSTDKIAQLLESEYDTAPRTSPNFRLRYAHQGQEGYGLIQEALAEHMPFAVAFIDIRMPPGWDGMETAKRIREIDPHIEIVIVTAYSDRSRDEIARHIGKSDKLLFLRKPFDPDELYQIALSLSEKWTVERHEESQRQDLETILSTSPVAIFTVNSNCHITSWNAAAEKITGYTTAEVINKPCIMTGIASESCLHCPIKGRDKSDIASDDQEISITNKDGKQKIIHKRVSFIRDKKGHIVKAVETFWDNTAKKEAEKALHDSEKRLRTLVETTSDWVWEMDADGAFTYCSPLCEDIFGFMPEELLGKRIFETLLPPDEVPQFELVFNKSLTCKKSFKNIERRSMRKDGKIIYIESSGAPIINETGEIIGFRGIDRDITDRIKTEREKALLEEQFRQSQKMEVLGTLAGGIAHDFNNLLTPILLNTQVSMAGLDKKSQLFLNLQDINKSAENASALIRQILSFGRKQVLLQRSLDLNEIITNFSKMLRRLIRENIELRLELAHGLWNINADSSQIEQILINLVVNARDAIAANGEITVTTQNENIKGSKLVDIENNIISGPYVVLSVRDNGMGMDASTMKEVFAPFYTTKEEGVGTGLGLSLVHGIVSQYNGHIRMESNINQGSTFHLYFKKANAPAKNIKKNQNDTVQGGNETILMVEDNMEVRVVLKTTLRNFGYKIIEADNGDEALEKFSELNGNIDLLLTDVIMPGLGGRDLADQIRATRPALPVIFMSGHPFDPKSFHVIADQKVAFIQKPFYPKNIAKKIRQLLDSAKKHKPESTEV